MKYDVAEDILFASTQCPHGYQCLSDGEGHVCKVVRAVDDGVVIETRRRVDCPYAASCQEGVQCTCPTRRELYLKFGL
jgi:hypothetical protein